MPSYAIKSSGIRQVAANSLIGNSTGSTGSAEELSATDAKTLLGLGTTDSPTFAGLTIDQDSSYAIGVSKIAYKSGGGGAKARISVANVTELELTNSKLAVAKSHAIGFSSTSYADVGFLDTALYRDDAGALAQRNGTNSQAFRIYNTDDGSQTNYERLNFETSSGNWVIGTSAGGTGQTGRSIKIRKDGADEFVFGNGKNISYQNLVPSADNTYRLGGSSGERWSSLYAASTYLDNIYHSSGGGRLQLGSSGYTLYAELSCNRLIPRADATYDLGAETLAWDNIKNTGSILCYNGGASDSTNYERGAIEWDSNVFTIGTESAGTGTGRSVELIRNGVTFLELKSNSSVTVYTSLYPSSSGSLNNGFSSLRWANVYSENADLSEALTLTSHTPATTTNKLYNVGGTLYFNGASAGGNPFDQDLNTTDSPSFASATIGNITLSDAGSYDSITSGDARLALRAQDGSMELYLENASDGNDSFRFNTANGIFELFSDADNQIDLRNGTSPNSLNVYETWTDASNYERGTFKWDSSVLKLGTEKAGTGSSRSVDIIYGGTRAVRFSTITKFYQTVKFNSSSYNIGESPNNSSPGDIWAQEGMFAGNSSTPGRILAYNLYSDASNYERGGFDWTTTANTLTIGTQAAGTGTLRAVDFIGSAFDFDNKTITAGELQLGNTGQCKLDFAGTSLYATGPEGIIFRFESDTTNTSIFKFYGNSGDQLTASSGVQSFFDVDADVNQSSTAGYTGIDLDITETATGSGDKNLMDLKVGGTSKFKVDNAGMVTTAGGNGSGTAGGMMLGNSIGWISRGTGSVELASGSAEYIEMASDGITLRTGNSFGWSANNNPQDGSGPRLWENTTTERIELRRGTTALGFAVANTWTDASNLEFGVFDFTTTSNVLTIGTEAAGTGTVRDLVLATGGTESIKVAGSNQRITISADRTAIGSGASHSGVLNIGGDRVMQFHGGNSSIRSPSGQLDFRTSTSVFTLVGSTIRFSGYDGGGFLNIRNSSTGGVGTVVIRKLASQTSDLFKVLDDSGNNLFKIDSSGDVAIDGAISQLLMTPTGSFGRWLKLYTSGSSPTVDAQDSLSLKADGTTAFTINHGGVDNSYIYTGDVYFNPLTSMALGQHNTPIEFLSYGSYSDASNYERLKIESGTAYNIRVQAVGTGTGRDLNIHSGASAALRLGVDGTNYIIMTSSGVKPAQDLFPNANDSYKNGTTSNRWSETNTVDLNSTGDINFSGLPTSSSGLSTGDLYLQSSGVPGGDYQIMVKT